MVSEQGRARWRAAVCVAVAAAAWLPSIHVFFGAKERDMGVRHEALLAAELAASAEGARLGEMRAGNPEWDLLSRTFLALSLANEAVAAPARKEASLAQLDRLIAETRSLVERHGDSYFLLPYGSRAAFAPRPARSLFVEGELLLMMSARRLAGPGGPAADEMKTRAAALASWMSAGEVASAESYPDECWTFCNTAALAALALHDAASGEDHGALERRWVQQARERLIDPATGLLVSSYHRDGRAIEGPEGSSLWVSTHFLSIIDEPFAREQYARARAQLGREVLGFGVAREWPEGAPRRPDVDSGAVIPLLDASAGSSGLWLIGAATMGDREALSGLMSSLDLAAFPSTTAGGLRYQAAGRVGNAALLYALSQGPLFSLVRDRAAVRRGS
jgi:hypothetical protein